jgi:hypothetical protein
MRRDGRTVGQRGHTNIKSHMPCSYEHGDGWTAWIALSRWPALSCTAAPADVILQGSVIKHLSGQMNVFMLETV